MSYKPAYSSCFDKQKLLVLSQIICELIWNIFGGLPSLTVLHLYDTVALFCFVSLSYVLLELVETERDYVRDLGSVVEVKEYICIFIINKLVNQFTNECFHSLRDT